MALDLGGTNFRVLLVSLDEERTFLENRIYPTPDEVKSAPAVEVNDNDVICRVSA